MPTSPESDESAREAAQEEGHGQQTDAAAEGGGSPESDGDAAAAVPGELAALREELKRSDDRYRRALADLENYRKRTERDGDRRAAEAKAAELNQWLSALDSVERALTMQPDDPGLLAVLEQMDAILTRDGVHRVAVVGDPFDPTRHDAIAVQPSEEVPDRTVLAVARSGFARGDDVLREAQVVVSRKPEGAA